MGKDQESGDRFLYGVAIRPGNEVVVEKCPIDKETDRYIALRRSCSCLGFKRIINKARSEIICYSLKEAIDAFVVTCGKDLEKYQKMVEVTSSMIDQASKIKSGNLEGRVIEYGH